MAKKLIHTDVRYHGSSLTVPVDQKIDIGTDGSVIVSDEAAVILLTIPNWELAKNQKNVPKEELKLAGEDDEENSGIEWLKEIDLDKLSTLEFSDLVELAKEGKIEGYEKFGKNKVALAKFIKSRLLKMQN